MKKFFAKVLALVLCSLVVQANAQKNIANLPKTKAFGQPIKSKVPTLDGHESGLNDAPVSIPPAVAAFRTTETVAGKTVYDLQSNSGTNRRIHNWGNGVASGTWTMSLTGSEAAGYADRGTGYNKTGTDGVFASLATGRIENIRTGFPSYVVLANGDEWVFTHTGPLGAYIINYTRKTAGSSTWQAGQIPTTTPNGGLWTRACAGGPDGNTIHLIYYTTPTGTNFGGSLVDGIDGTLRYCRSTNGGQTWDKVDITLPGLTSDIWNAVPVEGYFIDAHENTVAIGIFAFNNDCLMLKSTDNGDTWETPRVINEFPLEKWSFDDGYTFDEVGMTYDSTFYPDSLAIFTSDETGTIIVDDNGLVHAFYPGLFISDPDTTQDNLFTWWPAYNVGIVYWNESMGNNEGILIANAPDLDGDGTFGTTGNHYTAGYGSEALSTGPSAGLDAYGRIYMSYIADHELLINVNGDYLRRPFVVRSEPGNFDSWSDPVELITNDNVSDTTIAMFWECYFASMARKVDENVHILVQQDFEPGITFRLTGNQDPVENDQLYFALPTQNFIGSKEAKKQSLDFAIAPNPASDRAQFSLQLDKQADLVIEVFNAIGERVAFKTVSAQPGLSNVDMQLGGLANGMYFVKISGSNLSGAKKLLVARR